MEDNSFVDVIWALACLAFPICTLAIAIIFKKDIKLFLSRRSEGKLLREEKIAKISLLPSGTTGSVRPEKVPTLSQSNCNLKEEVAEAELLLKNDGPSESDEPPYIQSYRNLLENADTVPSRMLQCIEAEGSITSIELKNILSNKYGYLTETSGSFSASLRVLLIDGYINIEGTGDNKIISVATLNGNPYQG